MVLETARREAWRGLESRLFERTSEARRVGPSVGTQKSPCGRACGRCRYFSDSGNSL